VIHSASISTAVIRRRRNRASERAAHSCAVCKRGRPVEHTKVRLLLPTTDTSTTSLPEAVLWAGDRIHGRHLRDRVSDMHRELYKMYFSGDMVMVELSLNGTHNGDLVLPFGVSSDAQEMHTPCADLFHIVDGKVSGHCYVAVPILLSDSASPQHQRRAEEVTARGRYVQRDLLRRGADPGRGSDLTPDLIAKHAEHLRELDGDGKLVWPGRSPTIRAGCWF